MKVVDRRFLSQFIAFRYFYDSAYVKALKNKKEKKYREKLNKREYQMTYCVGRRRLDERKYNEKMMMILMNRVEGAGES